MAMPNPHRERSTRALRSMASMIEEPSKVDDQTFFIGAGLMAIAEALLALEEATRADPFS